MDIDLFSSRNMILNDRKVEKNTVTVKKKIKLLFEKGFSIH